jgi:hypothetical protein
MKTALLAGLAALALSLTALSATALQKGENAKSAPSASKTQDTQAVIEAQLPSYPGNYCLVHGGRFTAEQPAQNLVIDGQLYRVCSSKCASKVEIDTVTYYERLRKTIIGDQKASWALETCPVSGDAFGGEHGAPVDHIIGTRYVKLCCKGCLKTANADEAKFLADLDAKLIPILRKTYPLDTCAISGEKLGSMGDPIEMMYGHRLVRLCCKGCMKSFKEDPAAFMEKVYPRKKGSKSAGKGAAAPKKDAPEKAPKK